MRLRPKPPKFHCCDCGACCACSEVELRPGDSPPPEYRDGDRMRAVLGPDGRMGRCAALIGEVGQPGIRCAIYHDRPKICREVKRYDPLCFACRWHFRLPGGRIEECVRRDLVERHGKGGTT